MNVIFFAQSRAATGCDRAALEIEHAVSQAEFWARLTEAYPALAPVAKTARLARHEAYLEPGDLIAPEDEIAVIPPVSGG